MAEQNRTAYIDFVKTINGVNTAIRIFETHTHVFVYVNQFPVEMHLYSDMLKSKLQSKCRKIRHKEFGVICNLSSYDAFGVVAENIIKILSE